MRRDPLWQPGQLRRHMTDAVQLARGHRTDLVLAREQIDAGPRDPIPVPQQVQKLRRQHGEAVLPPLALLHADQHALAVDVGDFEGTPPPSPAIPRRRQRSAPLCTLGSARLRAAAEPPPATAPAAACAARGRRPDAALSPAGRASTLKKNRSAVTVAFMVGGLVPVLVKCSWKARSSSAVAVSGERRSESMRAS